MKIVIREVYILTPEKTVVTVQLATLGSRSLAFVLDLFILLVAITILSVVVGIMGTFGFLEELAMLIYIPILAVSPFLYFALFGALWNGQTPGKASLRIRAAMADGTPITPLAAFGRSILLVADFLPSFFLAGLVSMLSTPQCQRLGDLAAGTIVVHNPRPVPQFRFAPHKMGVHPLEAYVGELTGMTMEEYLAVKQLVERYAELPPKVQNKMIQEVWRPIARKRGIPVITNAPEQQVMAATVMKYGRMHGLF